jgi:hypothetical protein
MKKLQWFYERPYIARGEAVPEKEGVHYAVGVIKGFNYYHRYEMSLWRAWGVALISLFPIVLLGYFAKKPMETISSIIVIIDFLVFGMLWLNAGFSTADRLASWLFATEKRGAIVALVALVVTLGSIGFSVTHPAEILTAFKDVWVKGYSFYFFLGVFALYGTIQLILLIAPPLVRSWKKRQH